MLSPEIAFDALWYHLTLPKLWLFKHQWYFPGGLLYYSVMPRLAETLFIPLIHYLGFVGPKLLQFISALLTSSLIYKILKNQKVKTHLSFLGSSLFYVTWVVSWQSASGYIDLFRTFLELSAIYLLIRKKYLFSGMVIGLAIGTKLFALVTLFILSLVFTPVIVIPAIIVSLPWYLIAYHFTGNPVYPLFDSIVADNSPNLLMGINQLMFLPTRFTIPVDDFISPVAGVVLVLGFINYFYTQNQTQKKLSLIGILGVMLVSFLNPPSSRYYLPYYPLLIISAIDLVNRLKNRSQKLFITLSWLSFLIILTLRLIALDKYLPYLFHRQSLNQFLTSMSSKLPDTFIDSDNFVQNNLTNSDKIIIDKLHNLYYFPYNFDHTSWQPDISGYDYLVTKNEDPKNISGKLINTNPIGIQVFRLND